MPKYQCKELKATRLGFGEALVKLGKENPNVVGNREPLLLG